MASDIFDRYGGSDAWDRYCEREDERQAAAKWGEECGTCKHCETPEKWLFRDYPPIGWCKYNEFFIDPDCHPGDYDCDEWE